MWKIRCTFNEAIKMIVMSWAYATMLKKKKSEHKQWWLCSSVW